MYYQERFYCADIIVTINLTNCHDNIKNVLQYAVYVS